MMLILTRKPSSKCFNNLLVLLVICFLSFIKTTKARSGRHAVLVISLDGMGHDYLNRSQLVHIRQLFQEGSSPQTFTNQYPTKTVPNHFSVATGLYIESHGVVGNVVYDTALHRSLNISQPELFQQKKGVLPIWILNEIHGGVSACLMWPGCGMSYEGARESFYVPYSNSASLDHLIDLSMTFLLPHQRAVGYTARDPIDKADAMSVLQDHLSADVVDGNKQNSGDDDLNVDTQDYNYLNTDTIDHETSLFEDERTSTHHIDQSDVEFLEPDINRRIMRGPANLVMLYHNEPDNTGHNYGPNSPQLDEVLQKVDASIGYLMAQLAHYKLRDTVDVVVLSDHGMAAVLPTHVIDLSTIVDPALYTTAGTSPMLQVYTKEEDSLIVYDTLLAASDSFNYSVILPDNLPQNLHYSHNSRVAKLLVQADPGYVFKDFWDNVMQPLLEEEGNPDGTADESREFGNHGYSLASSPAMEPFLVAVGPSFNINYTVAGEASNVDVFPVLCRLLSVPLPPNNGSLAALLPLLRPRPNTTLKTVVQLTVVVVVVGGLSLVLYGLWARAVAAAATVSTGRRRYRRHHNTAEALIAGYAYSPALSASQTSAVFVAEDDLDEEEKLLTHMEMWDV